MALLSVTSKRLINTQLPYSTGVTISVPQTPPISPEAAQSPNGILEDVLADIVVPLALSISVTLSTIMSWIAVSSILANVIMGPSLRDLVHLLQKEFSFWEFGHNEGRNCKRV